MAQNHYVTKRRRRPKSRRRVDYTTSTQAKLKQLADADKRVFVEAILNPPEPNEKLRVAAERYRQEVETV